MQRRMRADWPAMQRRVPIWDAAGSLGMTVKQMESTYGHHHPDFQQDAADAYQGARKPSFLGA